MIEEPKSPPLKKYHAWKDDEGLCLCRAEDSENFMKTGQLNKDSVLMYVIEAQTWEEAQSIHNLRLGFGPYVPMGKPEPCPKCGGIYYPLGSGECYNCGKIC